MEDEQELAPDYLGTLVACRAWTVGMGPVPGDDTVYQQTRIDPAYKLWSISQRAHWWRKDWNIAECKGQRSHGGVVPWPNCMCGFYGLATWEQLFDQQPSLRPEAQHNAFRAYGTIEVAGRVIPGDNGFRAEKAKVRSLLLPSFEPYGDVSKRRKMAKQLKQMRAIVQQVARNYGVPAVEQLEDLTDPQEVIDEHREGTRDDSGGTPGNASTTTGAILGPGFTYSGEGTGASLMWQCPTCAQVMSPVGNPTYEHQCHRAGTTTTYTIDWSNPSFIWVTR